MLYQTSKPLSFYANLSIELEPPQLTQSDLRKLLNRLLSVRSKSNPVSEWRFVWESVSWIDANWNILIEDRAGVIRWASQNLVNDSQGGNS